MNNGQGIFLIYNNWWSCSYVQSYVEYLVKKDTSLCDTLCSANIREITNDVDLKPINTRGGLYLSVSHVADQFRKCTPSCLSLKPDFNILTVCLLFF